MSNAAAIKISLLCTKHTHTHTHTQTVSVCVCVYVLVSEEAQQVRVLELLFDFERFFSLHSLFIFFLPLALTVFAIYIYFASCKQRLARTHRNTHAHTHTHREIHKLDLCIN